MEDKFCPTTEVETISEDNMQFTVIHRFPKQTEQEETLTRLKIGNALFKIFSKTTTDTEDGNV